MGNGYYAPPQGEYGPLVDDLRRLAERLAELEGPNGTSMNSLVDQVQDAIANITTTVNAAIVANSYTKAQIDNLVANPPAGSNVTGNVTASGSVSAAGNISVGGTTTSTGDMFTPNATAAVSGYTICYLNSDGRVSKGASSARYKVSIEAVDPSTLGDLFPALQTYEMLGDPEQTAHLGYIAEHLVGNPDQERFVVWQYNGDQLAVDDQGAFIPESIDFIGLLLAQTSQLNQWRVQADERLKAAGL